MSPRVVFFVLLAASAAALSPAALSPAVRAPATSAVRGAAPIAVASAAIGGGSYGVGAGEWPASVEPRQQQQQQKRTPSSDRRGGDGRRGPNGGKRGSGRGRGNNKRGSGAGGRGVQNNPQLSNVLRKMKALELGATFDDVHGVLGGKRLAARDYTTVLTQLKQRRNWKVALLVGEWLQQRSANISALAGADPITLPNRAHYQVMLGACATSGAATEAQQLADEMRARGVPTDPTVLSTLVLANERARQPQRALALLDELEAMVRPAEGDAAVATAAEGSAVDADAEAAAAVAEAVAAKEPTVREAAVAAAVEAFFTSKDMASPPQAAQQEQEPQEQAPPAAASSQQQEQARPAAAAAKPAAAGKQHTPTVDPLAFAYASAIRAHDASGDWKGALGLYDRMTARGVQADAHCYSAALGACRRGSKGSKARSVLSSVRAEGRVPANGVMFTLAMAACNAAGEWEESLALLEERRGVEGAGVDAYGFSVAMGACAQGRQWERALELLEEMEADETCRGNSFGWNNAMVACNKAEQHQQTLLLYERMRFGACELTEHSIAAALVACRASGESGEADWERAQRIFDGHAATTRSSPMSFAALLDVLADGEQWALVLRYFDRLRELGTPTERAYERAIEACDRVDPDRAVELFEEMKVL